VARGELLSSLSITSTRNNAELKSYFTNGSDVATKVGVMGTNNGGYPAPLNSDPMNYGLPNLVFNGFIGAAQTQPNLQLTQTISLSALSLWTHGTHNIRFGADVHRVEFNLFGGTNATGTFIFTGAYTQQAPAPTDNLAAVSGSSFADFLLGLPQQTTIEAAQQKAYMRQNNWDLIVRDDWRVLSNLSILGGLRYDYYSPYAEKYDRLSTLDYTPGFTMVAPVEPNGIGPLSHVKFPRTLINPERNNFSPPPGT
jgi:hypothetical protein